MRSADADANGRVDRAEFDALREVDLSGWPEASLLVLELQKKGCLAVNLQRQTDL